MQSARAVWEVTAGIVPGQPDPAYTRRWVLTADEWADDEGYLHMPRGVALFNAQTAAAMEYARALMEPATMGWVKLEWVWY